MIRKAVFIGLIAALFVFGASLSFANQIDGMASNGDTVNLPQTLVTSVNPGGLGDSLIYGYYNVRGNLNIFNVVNTNTADGAKVRVVFRNGKNSKEVLDFNVCLSRGDTWTGYLLDDGTQARIFDDGAFTSVTGIDVDTITAPAIPTSGQKFQLPDSTVTTDDTREGYFEIVGMSTIPNYDKNSSSTHACSAGDYTDAGYNCIRSQDACNNWQPTGTSYDVANVLMGNNNIINLGTLSSHAYNATAIADAANTAFDVPSGSEVSTAYAMQNWTTGIGVLACDRLDYLLTKSDVMSTYDLISALGGESEYILTFPTRYVCHNTDLTEQTNLFNGVIDSTASNYVDNHTYTSYCTKVTPSITNYDELTPSNPLQFSPHPQTTFCLPNEVNVIKLGGSDIWDSSVSIDLDSAGFSLGWINFGFTGGTHYTDLPMSLAGGGTSTTNGIPAIAISTQGLVNDASGYMAPMAYKTSIINPLN
jgi:hypothetical protein